MSTKIQIGTEIITFPTSGTDANWAEAVDQFAIAVAEQLSLINTANDVAPTVLLVPNGGVLDLSSAIFPSGTAAGKVRSFVLTYAIYKASTGVGAEVKVESGTFSGVYSTTAGWITQREFVGDRFSDGTSYHTFRMKPSDTDQVQLVVDHPIGGATYDTANSKITYSAKTEPVSV
jgi:hypothetical protein